MWGSIPRFQCCGRDAGQERLHALRSTALGARQGFQTKPRSNSDNHFPLKRLREPPPLQPRYSTHLYERAWRRFIKTTATAHCLADAEDAAPIPPKVPPNARQPNRLATAMPPSYKHTTCIAPDATAYTTRPHYAGTHNLHITPQTRPSHASGAELRRTPHAQWPCMPCAPTHGAHARGTSYTAPALCVYARDAPRLDADLSSAVEPVAATSTQELALIQSSPMLRRNPPGMNFQMPGVSTRRCSHRARMACAPSATSCWERSRSRQRPVPVFRRNASCNHANLTKTPLPAPSSRHTGPRTLS